MSKTVCIKIPIYGLPPDTDIKEITSLVREMTETLEEMGIFDQFAYEPLYCLNFDEGGSIE